MIDVWQENELADTGHRAAGVSTDQKRLLILGFLVAILVGLLTWVYQWWAHPDLFQRGESYKVLQNAEDLRPIHIAVSELSEDAVQRTIRIDDVQPNVEKNGTRAEFEFVLCQSNPDQDPFQAARNLERYCDLIRDAEGADMRLGPASGFDVLVLTITPTRPGVTRIESVDVDYSLGASRLWQHGSETIGPETSLKVG